MSAKPVFSRRDGKAEMACTQRASVGMFRKSRTEPLGSVSAGGHDDSEQTGQY